MKTTVEIPDTTLRRAKTMAAAKGMKLKELLVEAIEDKVSNAGETSKASEPAWMKLHGAFAKTRAMRAETRRIQRVIDGEFEQIDPENWK
jgi:ribosomal protein L1